MARRLQFRISTLLWLALVIALALAFRIQRLRNVELQQELSHKAAELEAAREARNQLMVEHLLEKLERERTQQPADPVQALIDRLRAEATLPD